MKIVGLIIFVGWYGYWLVRLYRSVVGGVRQFARLDALSEAEDALTHEALTGDYTLEEMDRMIADARIIQRMRHRKAR